MNKVYVIRCVARHLQGAETKGVYLERNSGLTLTTYPEIARQFKTERGASQSIRLMSEHVKGLLAPVVEEVVL